jgi:hypothetical protein
LARDRRSSRAIDVIYRFDPSHPGRPRQPGTPGQARERLLRGNRRFAGLLESPSHRRVIPLDPSAAGYGTVKGADAILVAVRRASLALEEAHGPGVTGRPGYRAALIETSVALNACLSAFALKQELEGPRLRVLFGSYDLASRAVGLPLAPDRRRPHPEAGLFAPPDDDRGLGELAVRIAAAPGVASLLRPRYDARRP